MQVVKQMGGVKELFKDEKQIKNLNPAKMGKVYQSMAKAMDPHMLRAIGGMQGIESMMKQMQAGGAMPGGMGMQGLFNCHPVKSNVCQCRSRSAKLLLFHSSA